MTTYFSQIQKIFKVFLYKKKYEELSLKSSRFMQELKNQFSNLNSTAGYIEITSQSYRDITDNLSIEVNSISIVIDEIIKDSEETETRIHVQYEEFINLSVEVNQNQLNIKDILIQLQELMKIFENQSSTLNIGKSNLKSLNESIEKIKNTNSKINSITSSISGIAKKTSLLSINASIEATHAGEFGQGFSVVSNEISKLSRNSSISAREIDKINAEVLFNLTEVIEKFDELSNIMSDIIEMDHSFQKKLSTYHDLVLILVSNLENIEKMTMHAISNLSQIKSEITQQKEKYQSFRKMITNLVNGITNIHLSAEDLSELSIELKGVSSSFNDILKKFGQEN